MGGWIATEFTLTYPARAVVGARRRGAQPSVPYRWNKHTPSTALDVSGFDAAMALDQRRDRAAFGARPALAAAAVSCRAGFPPLARRPPRDGSARTDRLSEIDVPT